MNYSNSRGVHYHLFRSCAVFVLFFPVFDLAFVTIFIVIVVHIVMFMVIIIAVGIVAMLAPS